MSTPTPELLDEARRELRALLDGFRTRAEHQLHVVAGLSAEPPTPELVNAMTQAFEGVDGAVTPPGLSVEAAPNPDWGPLTRLCALLGLSERERAFITAALDDAADFDLYSVLADYLEDQGRTRDGARVRRLVPRDGDVLVWQTGVPGPGPWERPTAYQEAADRVRKGLAARGVDTHAVTLPAGADLSAVDPEQMRLAGWVRDGEAHRLALERAAEELERAACGEDGPYASPDMLRARARQLRHFAAETP